MTEAWIFPAALVLDRFLGDPRTHAHPVRLVGRYAAWMENRIRSFGSGSTVGLFAFLAVLVGSLIPLWLTARVAETFYSGAAFVVGVLALYVSMAPTDLARHAGRVLDALDAGDVEGAREAVACIVGRDTEPMEAPDICRAAVETVAESCVDGVTAPLFWATLLGPLGAFGYRVVNTLDSMWGHEDARYQRFGLVAARVDDVANFLPARLTAIGIALAAALLRMNACASIVVAFRHGPRHRSPNSGWSEAAFAGALDVTLGGANRYDGVWQLGPRFGYVPETPTIAHLRRSIRLMWVVTILASATSCVTSWLLWRSLGT